MRNKLLLGIIRNTTVLKSKITIIIRIRIIKFQQIKIKI